MFWIDGRFAWPAVLAVLFSTLTVVAIDFAWRTVQAPVSLVAVAGGAIFLAGNVAIFILGARAR